MTQPRFSEEPVPGRKLCMQIIICAVVWLAVLQKGWVYRRRQCKDSSQKLVETNISKFLNVYSYSFFKVAKLCK